MTYPHSDPLLAVDWYKPVESVWGIRGTPLPRESPGKAEIPSRALATVTRYAGRMNSCALLVLHRGVVVLEKYWCGLNPASRPNAMSMTKTVVALLVGVAMEEGLIGHEGDRVCKYLPQWREDARREITIKHLLQMTSGLRNSSSQSNPFSDLALVHLGTRIRQRVLSIPAVDLPGAAFSYNNLNTQVLSILLESATSRRFAHYLSEKLWRPLGASSALLWLDEPGGTAKTYCCLFATARDWARMGALLLHHGRVGDRQVVPAHWIARMLRPSPRQGTFGYHIWLGRDRVPERVRDWSEPFLARDTFMLIGQGEQRVFVIPSRDLVVVRLGREAGGWDDPYIPNVLVQSLDRARGRDEPREKSIEQPQR